MTPTKNSDILSFRPPIVAVLGHVDHGKTTLLDAIRKANVADQEHGGITQSIGAYQVEVKTATERPKKTTKSNSDQLSSMLTHKHQRITFIDTPGHEAFTKMRSRGAIAADIVLLVVASDDSVKPQTIESIKIINDAGIPMIVVATKIDMPGMNLDKLRSDLARHGIQTEGFGGNVPFVPVSAKEGKGIDILLNTILAIAELEELKNETHLPFQSIVIETRIDKGKGMVGTVIVKSGILKTGMDLYDDITYIGRVRAMFDEYGSMVAEAFPSKPVEVLGFHTLPVVGSIITSEKQLAQPPMKEQSKKRLIPSFLAPISNEKRLSIFLKANTSGALEAIMGSLHEKIDVIHTGIGAISESDILTTKTSKAILIGFQVGYPSSVHKLADEEKVVVRIYQIIYELLEELEDVALNLREITREEKELGKALIIAEFPFNGEKVAGCKISDGRLARGDIAKLMRGDEEKARIKIKSIRKGKDPIDKVTVGHECGVLFDGKVDFFIGDVIIPISQ